MNTLDALLHAWRETLARRGRSPAILDSSGRVLFHFRGVDELSRSYADEAGWLRDFAPGEVVAIQIGNHPHWPALFLACLQKGVATLPLERSLSAHEVTAALRICRVSGLICDPEKGVERIDAGAPVNWDGRTPVLLKLTSGTTAAARAVRFRGAQLLADAAQICDTMGISERDLNFAVIPLSHSYGFSNLVTPLLARGVPMAISADRIPRAVLRDLAQTEATVFPGMPVFYQAFAEMSEVPTLPRLRLCISAGAPLPLTVARKFREKFGRPIHSFYGASECGGICYDREAKTEHESFVGAAMDGVALERLSPADEPTQLRVHTAAAGDGYFPQPEPGKLGANFFVPDDLVATSAEGVRIVGRVSDVINVAGRKVNPAEVEQVLLGFAGVRQAVVFGRASGRRNQEVVACVVAAAGIQERDLREFCGARLSGWQVPRRIFFLDAIPVNERGKTSRRELAERFPAGDAPND